MRHGAGDGSCTELADGAGIFVTLTGELCACDFVDHEVEADVWRDACDGRDYAAVKGRKASFGLIHVDEEGPHAR